MPADLNDYFKKKNGGNKGGNDGGGVNFEPPEFLKNGGGKFMGMLYILIALIVILVVAKPFVIITSGQMGIMATAGKFDETPLKAGIHFFVPIIQKVIVVDTRVRIMSFSSKDQLPSLAQENVGITRKRSISVLDARNLSVLIDLTIQYKLIASNVPETIKNWGSNWEEKMIDPLVTKVVRNVIGQYTAEELSSKRDNIAKEIDISIRKSIDGAEGKPAKLLSVLLREIVLPPKVKEQIEQVQTAKQRVEKASLEAQKKATEAEGDAKARRIEAKGKADAIKIEADGEAYANQKIGTSLTTNLLNLRQIEVQSKFNEALKENKNAKIFLTPGGSTPNIWVDTKDTQQSTSVSQ